MSTPAMVPVFAPDGTLGDIPADRLQDAVKAGFKPGVNMTAPDGTKGVVPADRYVDAAKGGMKVDRIEDQPIQHPGFWHSLASDLVGMVKPGPGGGMSSPYPGVTSESGQLAWQNARVEAKSEADAGYSKPYMAAAGVARGLGVNVPGMEQSAKEGDAAGVLGHAAAVPVAMAATEGIARGAPLVAEAGPAVAPIARAAAETVDVATFKRASAIWNAWKDVPSQIRAKIVGPEPVFPGAPLPDHPGTFPGAPNPETPAREALQARSLQSGAQAIADPAAALNKISPPAVYPGAALPEHPGVFPGASLPQAPAREVLQARALARGGKPVKDPSGGLGAIPVNTPAPEPASPGFNKTAVSKQLDSTLNQATGGKPLQPGVKLRDQFKDLPAKDALASGSSAVKDYKYDPAANELHVTANNGVTYVSGDVSPAQAQAFEAADSKGQAWKAIRDNSPLVAKVIDGKRISMKGPSGMRSASPDAPTNAGDTLLDQLKQSVQLAKARKVGN